MTKEQALTIVQQHGIHDSVVVLGIRNKNNSFNIYDDEIGILGPDGYEPYRANTDPSVIRKGVAVLQPGVYLYKRGLHGISHLNLSDPADKKLLDTLLETNMDLPAIPGRLLPYWALRQAGPVTILREGQTIPETEMDQSQWPWIDIHRGGYSTTSSLGCQTIHPDVWPQFRSSIFACMKNYGQTLVKYCLIHG